MDKIPEHRTQHFKAKSAFKPEELRRNRNEQNVELRKQKREENLTKRRNLAIAAESEESEDEGVAAANSQVIERKSQKGILTGTVQSEHGAWTRRTIVRS
jgi:importin subunit alpha-1